MWYLYLSEPPVPLPVCKDLYARFASGSPKKKANAMLTNKKQNFNSKLFLFILQLRQKHRFAKQAEDVIALNAQLRQNKFFHKLRTRLGNNYMRLVELGNLPLVDNQHLVGKRKRFFRVMRNNDGGIMILLGYKLNTLLMDSLITPSTRLKAHPKAEFSVS